MSLKLYGQYGVNEQATDVPKRQRPKRMWRIWFLYGSDYWYIYSI